MDAIGKHYVQQNKAVSKIQISCFFWYSEAATGNGGGVCFLVA